MRRLCPAVVVAVLLAILAPPARADEALARQHFRRGLELYDGKRYAEALAAFGDAYREKPTASIKQNIGLTLKALGRDVEAATAFDEALAEGEATLKPETRAAIERELDELAKVVATLRVSVVAAGGAPVEPEAITVAGEGEAPRVIPAVAARRPIRLAPGTWLVGARAAGYVDPPEKRLALVAGAPVDATFVLSAGVAPGTMTGTLTVKASEPDATIKIDGVEVDARGSWTGPVRPGAHELEVAAPGRRTTTAQVNVPSGATVEYPVQLLAVGEAPPEYVAPAGAPRRKTRGAYVALMGSLGGVGYRLSDTLAEPRGGARRGFASLSVAGRFGYHVTRELALDLHGELGGAGAKYKRAPADAVESETTAVFWQLTPGLRYVGPGATRFTGGMGLGVHGMAVEAKLAQPGATLTKRGDGVALSWLVDAGFQADVGRVFFEAVLFMNVHGVGPVRDDDAPYHRLLLASPAVRAGLRVGLGIPF